MTLYSKLVLSSNYSIQRQSHQTENATEVNLLIMALVAMAVVKVMANHPGCHHQGHFAASDTIHAIVHPVSTATQINEFTQLFVTLRHHFNYRILTHHHLLHYCYC